MRIDILLFGKNPFQSTKGFLVTGPTDKQQKQSGPFTRVEFFKVAHDSVFF